MHFNFWSYTNQHGAASFSAPDGVIALPNQDEDKYIYE
jgi:hypothetical protein